MTTTTLPHRTPISYAVASVTKRDAVDETSLFYDEMAQDWDIVTDFLGSTRTLRELRDKWLPKMKKEKSDNYQRRLELSYLFPIFRDTIEKIVARPFSRDVQISKGSLPDRLKSILWNADGRGSSLTQFARCLFRDALAYGKSHILVEFPPTEPGETEEQQAVAGKTPFFTHIPATALIDWKDTVDPAGNRQLTEIRYYEQEVRREGDYRSVAWDVIWTIRADGTWQKHSRKTRTLNNRTGGYKPEANGRHSFPGVPLVTLYTSYRDFMVAEPPLLALAWINALHFRKLSRQAWHEEYVMTPILTRLGFTAEEIRAGVELGSAEGLGSTNPEAKVAWVESAGTAAKIGQDGLRAIEERAEVLGHQHLASRTGDVRATAIAVDEAKIDNNVQAWIRALEMTLVQALEMAGVFVNAPIPESLTVDVWSDFTMESRFDADVPQLIQLYRERMLTLTTALTEIRKRGLLASDFDVGAESALLEAQGPPMARIGLEDAASATFGRQATYQPFGNGY